MNTQFLIALLAGLGGMIGWGSADFFAKKTTDEIGSVQSLLWGHFFGTITFALMIGGRFLYNGEGLSFPTREFDWIALGFFGALQMIVYWFVYEAFGKGKLAVLNPIFASYSGLVALFALIFLGATINSTVGIALLVIFLGVIGLNLDIKGLRKIKRVNQPGTKEIFIAVILAAVWTIMWDKFVNTREPLSSSLIMYFFMTVAAAVFGFIKRESISTIKRGTWKYLVGIGLGEALAYAAISWGYSSTNLTAVVALIAGAFSLPTLILARLFLKEKVPLSQTISALIIVSGIILLVLGDI